ncbi:uncharacterized protein LOC126556835 [Anopheles maculipalpis]|uniref:uncharacterized protein LOC126556835 n=1 Tax=Anopheles maculipalpis TaxID=1496333 RepID=UPI002158B2DA|nr:uncharacterized protein LOC126556835 [Anopheles maculipalpis]
MQDNRANPSDKKRNKHPNRAPAPQDPESIHQQTRRIINDMPITPTMYDGSYPAYEEFTTTLVALSSESELSFSSESPDSDSAVHYQTADPIVELPLTPLRDDAHSRECVECEAVSPSMIGTALGSGTVLMQRSLENRLAKQLEEMHALMDNDEDPLVVLKEPSIRSMASQPAFNKEMMRGFMEHSETMFNLVHDTNGNSDTATSVQFVIGIEEEKATDTDAPGCSHRQVRHSNAVPTITDELQESEFVGCFSKDNNMVLYKRTMQEGLKSEHDDRKSIETLIAHHAECLVEADKVTEPRVHVRQGDDNNLLALLTFSDQSSAVLKTSSAMAEEFVTEEELNQALLTTYRQLLSKPDEMISMQTQAASGSQGPKQRGSEAKHQLRSDPRNNLSTGTSSFCLSNESSAGMVVEGSSKNWIKRPTTRHASEIVLNLRLLLEEYILRNISVTGTVLKFVSHVLSDVLRCTQQEIEDDFRQLDLLDKIKRVLDELLMPQELEDPLMIVNQLRHTIEEIQSYPIRTRTIMSGEDAWNCVFKMLEKLSCELNHAIEQPEQFVEALQYGIRAVIDASYIRSTDQRAGKVVSIDPSPVQLNPSFPSTSSILNMDRFEAPSVSFCRPYACFLERIVLCIWSVLVWIVNQMNSFWDFLNSPPPPLLSDPSATFKQRGLDDQQHQSDRDHLNQATNVLRIVLEKSSDRQEEKEDGKRTVNDRSMNLFTQLLNDAGNIELKYSNSHHNIRLQLHSSISGLLQKQEADEYYTLAGNIRDHEANVTVFFDARVIALESLAQVESFLESVTRIERLSDDVDKSSDELSDETVVHVPSGVRENDGKLIVSEMIHEMVANGNYEEQMQSISSLDAEQLLQEIKHCLQDLLEPVTMAVHKIFERFGRDDVGDSFTGAAEESTLQYTVGIEEQTTCPENKTEIQDASEERVNYPENDEQIGVSVEFNEDQIVDKGLSGEKEVVTETQLAETLQELLVLFHVTNDRLAVIDTDIAAIRNQVQQLGAVNQGPFEGCKPIRTEERYSRRKSSVKHVEIPSEPPKTQCPMQLKGAALFGHSGAYCPTEIYSCHAVAPDVLIVHWRVMDENVLHCITGFEIYVDDQLRSICFSNKRRTALIGNIDLQKSHHIMLHVTSQLDSDGTCKRTAYWVPALFLYHT